MNRFIEILSEYSEIEQIRAALCPNAVRTPLDVEIIVDQNARQAPYF